MHIQHTTVPLHSARHCVSPPPWGVVVLLCTPQMNPEESGANICEIREILLKLILNCLGNPSYAVGVHHPTTLHGL
jgi:hypothetical protein